ncbi:MAG: 50S ribosomal protein L28 [Candidatus Sumerlaeia bacterium]|nr:50S ribosomal protein L28 [Candidatus Sumerlaeia bacterium]
MATCKFTGKHTRIGNSVSHANNRTKRQFRANLQKVRIVGENGASERVWVATEVLRKNTVAKVAPRRVLLAQMAADGKLPEALKK